MFSAIFTTFMILLLLNKYARELSALLELGKNEWRKYIVFLSAL